MSDILASYNEQKEYNALCLEHTIDARDTAQYQCRSLGAYKCSGLNYVDLGNGDGYLDSHYDFGTLCVSY